MLQHMQSLGYTGPEIFDASRFGMIQWLRILEDGTDVVTQLNIGLRGYDNPPFPCDKNSFEFNKKNIKK